MSYRLPAGTEIQAMYLFSARNKYRQTTKFQEVIFATW